MATVFSAEQQQALNKVTAWLRIKYSPFFYLAGYAGSGKTTLAKTIAKQVNGKVAYMAYTGKAAKVMRSKGCTDARTIHSSIYAVDEDPDGRIRTTLRPDALKDFALVIVDECSMVDETIGKDLLSLNVPVLALGDPGQLPPIKGGGFFTGGTPDFMLTEVHRQAKDSPIIRLATEIRTGEWRRAFESLPGLTVTGKERLDPASVIEADMVLVGKNETRRLYNQRLRMRRGFTTEGKPAIGEQIICLRNGENVVNGEVLITKAVETRVVRRKTTLEINAVDADNPKRSVKVSVLPDWFINEEDARLLSYKELGGTCQFGFAHAITVHKSQGSQWANVCVFNEAFGDPDSRRRWLYTAVTRAASNLTLVI
jgi:exodeoxyribonuclease V